LKLEILDFPLPLHALEPVFFTFPIKLVTNGNLTLNPGLN
jgi:hypothetical protein